MVSTNQQAAARPRVVGRYALFDEIAAGGMATIHLGRLVGPVGFSRTVAIKTLHPQFAKDPDFVEMFLEEARLASRIQHPNVISTLDVATAEGEVFLVMEYVAGESLAKLVRCALKKGDRVPVEIGVSVLSGMLHGLHATHEAKNEQLEPMHIVHRDVSPQNVLVGLDGVARIFDFGVAKAAAMRSQATTDGQMKGKLSYMSPEQLNSRDVDRRTDVFAAGVVAWECLTGRRLFSGSDPGEVLAKVLTLDITPPIQVQPGMPRRLSDAVMRALERLPEQRWQTARDFAIELERNSALAAPHAVGDWVERNASDAVQDRRHRVEAVERASVELGHLVSGGFALLPSAAPTAEAAPAAVEANPALDNSDFANAGSRSSNLTVSSSAATKQPGSSRRTGVWLGMFACGAAAAAGYWYWQQGGLDWIIAGRSAPLPEPPGEAAPGKAPREPEERSSGAGPGSAETTPPPVLQIDSLPEQDDAPDAGVAPVEAEPAVPEEHAGASTHRVRRNGRKGPARTAQERAAREEAAREEVAQERAARGEANAPATEKLSAEKSGKHGSAQRADKTTAEKASAEEKAAADKTVADKASAAKVSELPGATPAKSECNPPWYIDAMGIRRIKPVCL